MRHPYPLYLAALLLGACEATPPGTAIGSTRPVPSAADPGRDAAAAAARFRAAGARLEAAPAETPPRLQALGEPLPDGILPGFKYSRLVDMTTRTAHTMRQIGLQVHGLPPEAALDSLADALIDRGWRAGARVEAGGGNLSRSFYKGGEGVGMTQVVASGGTAITITTSRYDASSSSQRQGFTGVLNIVINSP